MSKKKYFYVWIMIVLSILISCKQEDEIIISSEIFNEDASNDIIYKRLVYKSKNTDVKGYFIHPSDIQKKHPLIIYNRGGIGQTGSWSDGKVIDELSIFAENGFAVLASNYRDEDEYGGSDLNDVLSLIELAKHLDFIDEDKIHMMGISRGGLMTYMSIRASDDIKSAVVISGMTDFTKLYHERSDSKKNLYASIIGGTPESSPEAYNNRSPVLWADELDIPILIIHGGKDSVVNADHAISMYEVLEKNNSDIRLIIYEHANHGISSKKLEMNNEILKWFD